MAYPDEEQLLKEFLRYFVDGAYTEIIGYNVSFDYRYLIAKCMYYRISCKEFARVELDDLMQLMKQIKRKFVFTMQKPYSLSDWCDYFFNFPKPFTDAEMLKYYKKGEMDKVIRFSSEQVSRTYMLYNLFSFVTDTEYLSTSSSIAMSEGEGPPHMSNPEPSPLTIPEAEEPKSITKKCPECLAETEFPKGTVDFICPICKTKIE